MERLSAGYTGLALAYMAGIYYLSSLPGSATGPNTPGWRLASNAAHVPLFAGLAVCLVLALRAWPPGARARAVLGVGIAYALLDEWHQGWTPGRSMSAGDVALDTIGVAIVLLAVAAGREWQRA